MFPGEYLRLFSKFCPHIAYHTFIKRNVVKRQHEIKERDEVKLVPIVEHKYTGTSTILKDVIFAIRMNVARSSTARRVIEKPCYNVTN